jgi:mannose-6-phosphate isomerase-like protein (cupin superfamily)
MPRRIEGPTVVAASGNKPKEIREYVGRVNTGEDGLSVAHMRSPSGWREPGQCPEFDEYTLVLRGTLRVESRDGVLEIGAGQAVVAKRGEWVRYSTPGPEGAEYVAVCRPAFSPEAAHRDDQD